MKIKPKPSWAFTITFAIIGIAFAVAVLTIIIRSFTGDNNELTFEDYVKWCSQTQEQQFILVKVSTVHLKYTVDENPKTVQILHSYLHKYRKFPTYQIDGWYQTADLTDYLRENIDDLLGITVVTECVEREQPTIEGYKQWLKYEKYKN